MSRLYETCQIIIFFAQDVMKSPVVKRSIVIAGHKTSVSLEEAFWTSMKDISAHRKMTLSDLVSEINSVREQGNLSSAIRLSCSIILKHGFGRLRAIRHHRHHVMVVLPMRHAGPRFRSNHPLTVARDTPRYRISRYRVLHATTFARFATPASSDRWLPSVSPLHRWGWG